MIFKILHCLFALFTLISCERDRRIITTLKYSKSYVQPTIVNGEQAVTGQIPYLVSIKEAVYRIGDKRIVWNNICGGSIITEIKVLSAAHCFERNNFAVVDNPELMRIVAGNLRNSITHSGDTETNVIKQVRKIDTIIVHRHYYFPSNDIALIFVDEPWILTSNVNYINIATRSLDYPPSCLSAGFGRIGHRLRDAISPVLLVAPISVITKWRCTRLWEMNMNSFICSNSSLTDIASGDSGGPLACKDTKDPNESPNRYILVGVVSGKNFDKTSLYTRVSSYYDWIINNKSCVASGNYVCFIILFILIYVLFFSVFFIVVST